MVLMYVRFPLSLRNVEDLLFERGIDYATNGQAVVEQVRSAIRSRHSPTAGQPDAFHPVGALAP